jgi:FdhD protein
MSEPYARRHEPLPGQRRREQAVSACEGWDQQVAIMTTRRAIVRLQGSGTASAPDDLAVEAPLTLSLDDDVLAVVMRTPGHDLELAAGWLVAESGVRRPDDIAAMRESREGDGVRVSLAPRVEPPRSRAFVTSASCGVCSADLIDLLPSQTSAPHSPGWRVAREVIAGLPDEMRRRQRAFDRTGGLHAATLATASGEVGVVREDVGRHNAVDKIVGRALLDDALPATDRLLVVSGRVSFEIVQKALAAGCAGVVAVSAPSSLAVDLARTYGLLLAGLVRGERLNVYSEPELVD